MNKGIIVKPLNSVEEVFSTLTDVKKDQNINRYRSPYVYRGLSNIKYKLQTSLDRNCNTHQEELEKCILRSFTKYASILENPHLINSEWLQLIIGQHHGLPTRMMDWTCSSLVALHFAVSEESLADLDDHGCAIWAVNVEETNTLLPKKYQDILTKEKAGMFTTDMLKGIKLSDYDEDMSNNSFIMLEPPSIDERIVNQYSYFSVIPKGIQDFDQFLNDHTSETIKYTISKDLRWQIRDTLDTMNINERIMFPGYDGICKWLKRHYFCKKE